MKDRKTQICGALIGVLALAGLLLSAVEHGAGQAGLELRTFAQGIKGIYLWLVMPLGILYAGNVILKHRIHLLRKILLVFLTLAILCLSFFRGMVWFFSEEMVEEERLADGYLQGRRSSFLSETRTSYYEVVGGIFRKPFPGWNQEVLIQRMQEKYGQEVRCGERQPGGWYVFALPDALAREEYIYFHVSDSYEMPDNGSYQILLSEAGYFWANRNRWARPGGGPEDSFEQERDHGGELNFLPDEKRLYITCYGGGDDVEACAADLTDWLRFVRSTGQYPYETDPSAEDLLLGVYVGSGEDWFRFNMRFWKEFSEDTSWEEQYVRMRDELMSAFMQHEAQQEAFEERREEYPMEGESSAEESSPGGAVSEEDSSDDGVSFMDIWDGSFEKECLVGDGQIRYRMVVEDAALGSRFYGLLKSVDGGESWQMSNPDPFDQQMGQGIDFIFLDELFGFATLMHNGGDEADLYVTEDGGESYQPSVLEGYTVSLENGFTYNPYDYPQMPWEEDGAVWVLCGQGADGDYDGGDQAGLALYRSTDKGNTFSFVEIRKPE